jgi:hypothetical protein
LGIKDRQVASGIKIGGIKNKDRPFRLFSDRPPRFGEESAGFGSEILQEFLANP